MTPSTYTDGERKDYRIHGSYHEVRRVGSQIHLNATDEQFVETELTMYCDPDSLEEHDPEAVHMHINADDGGFEEGSCFVTLTPDQARDVAERLQTTANRLENGERYWEQ